jgi:hypothetical protein
VMVNNRCGVWTIFQPRVSRERGPRFFSFALTPTIRLGVLRAFDAGAC